MSRVPSRMGAFLAAYRLDRDLWILFTSFFLWAFGQGMYFYIWPLFMQDLGATPVQIGTLFSVAQLTMTLTYVGGGLLADRYDRKWVMILSWLIAVPSALVFARATRWTDLLPGIVMFYCFSGMPAFNAYVAARVSSTSRASAFSIVYASAPLGMLFAPALGGLLAEVVGMRTVFLISFGVYVAATLVMLPLRSQRPQPASAPALGQDASAGTGAIPGHVTDIKPVKLATLIPTFTLVTLAYFLLFVATPYISPYLRASCGMGMAQIGILGSVTAASELALSLVFGGVGGKWGKVPALAFSLTLFALSIACLTLPGGLYLLMLAFVLRGAARLAQSLMTAMVPDVSPRHALGRHFGAFGALTGVATVAAPYLGGWLYDLSPTGLFAGAACAIFALAIVVQALAVIARARQTRRRDGTPRVPA